VIKAIEELQMMEPEGGAGSVAMKRLLTILHTRRPPKWH
jgi:hypothetical protein